MAQASNQPTRLIEPSGAWQTQLQDVPMGDIVVLVPVRKQTLTARWLRPLWQRESRTTAQLCGALLQAGLADIRCVEDPKKRNLAIIATRKNAL